MKLLGIDIGGSGIKGALVDSEKGTLIGERYRIKTPNPAPPDEVAAIIKQIVEHFEWKDDVGCTFPSVVKDGKVIYNCNLGNDWKGVQVDEVFSKACGGLKFHVLNDADAAGLAELKYGAIKGKDGLVIMITIGTGLGSGAFYNGELLPNFELGRLLWKDGEVIEKYASDSARKREELTYKKWGKRFNKFLDHVETILAPDHIIIGGGASKKLHKFEEKITINTDISVAETLNHAGIVGAAVYQHHL